jgi:hypothetical protein
MDPRAGRRALERQKPGTKPTFPGLAQVKAPGPSQWAALAASMIGPSSVICPEPSRWALRSGLQFLERLRIRQAVQALQIHGHPLLLQSSVGSQHAHLTWPPGLLVPRLERAVEAEEDVPAFAGNGLHPIRFMAGRNRRAEIDIRRGIGISDGRLFQSSCRTHAQRLGRPELRRNRQRCSL